MKKIIPLVIFTVLFFVSCSTYKGQSTANFAVTPDVIDQKLMNAATNNAIKSIMFFDSINDEQINNATQKSTDTKVVSLISEAELKISCYKEYLKDISLIYPIFKKSDIFVEVKSGGIINQSRLDGIKHLIEKTLNENNYKIVSSSVKAQYILSVNLNADGIITETFTSLFHNRKITRALFDFDIKIIDLQQNKTVLISNIKTESNLNSLYYLHILPVHKSTVDLDLNDIGIQSDK